MYGRGACTEEAGLFYVCPQGATKIETIGFRFFCSPLAAKKKSASKLRAPWPYHFFVFYLKKIG